MILICRLTAAALVGRYPTLNNASQTLDFSEWRTEDVNRFYCNNAAEGSFLNFLHATILKADSAIPRMKERLQRLATSCEALARASERTALPWSMQSETTSYQRSIAEYDTQHMKLLAFQNQRKEAHDAFEHARYYFTYRTHFELYCGTVSPSAAATVCPPALPIQLVEPQVQQDAVNHIDHSVFDDESCVSTSTPMLDTFHTSRENKSANMLSNPDPTTSTPESRSPYAAAPASAEATAKNNAEARIDCEEDGMGIANKHIPKRKARGTPTPTQRKRSRRNGS